MQHGSSPCYQRLALRSAPPRPSLPPRARGAPIGDGFSERRLSAELPLVLGAGLGLQVARKGRDGRGDGALPAKEAKEGASGVRLPEILRFVWPVMLTLLASTLQGLIDSVFVGRCGGSVQLAALAPATSFLDGLSYVLSFTAIGTLNVLAAAGGTPQDDEHERLLLRSLTVATTVGCVLAVPVFFFAPHLVAFCGARGPVVSLSAQYVKIRAFGLPLDSLFRVANAGLLSIRDSRTGLQVVAFQSLLNGLGDALICPSMGIAGAAVTTVVAQAVTTAAMVVSLRRKGLVRHFRLPALRDSLDFLAFALPVCLTLALKVASVQFLGIAAAARGVVAAAAHQITKSLLWVFGLLASESLSSTAQAFLPASMQSGDVCMASQTLRLLLKLGASGALATAGLLCLVAAKGGLRIFCEDPAVLSAVPLVSLSCCILLTPFAFCMEGAHIAAQRQQWLSRRLCLLTSLVGLTFRFALPADAGLSQVWAVFAAYLLGRAIWYAWGLWGPQGVLKKAKVTVESYLEDQGT